MKTLKTIVNILTALATVAGAVYIAATYGDKIVAWAKAILAKCPCNTPAEEAAPVEEAPAAEEAPCCCEEAPAEEAPCCCEEAPAEEAPCCCEEAPAEEAPAAEVDAPVAEESDFEA